MKLFNQYRGLRKELYYLFIGRVITAMGSFVMPLITLILRRKLDFTPSQISIILTIFFLITLPAAFIGGKLTDKIGRKKIIIIFDCLTVILYIIAGLMPISIVTIVLVMAAGFFAQIEQPSYDALVADFSTTKDREKAYSMGYLGWNLGYIAGPTLAGLLFENHLGLCFIITAIATFATTLIVIFFIHEKNSIKENTLDTIVNDTEINEYERSDNKNSLFKILADKKILLYVILSAALIGAVYSSVSLILPLAMEEQYAEMGATYYGFSSSLNGLVVILATPILTLLLKKRGSIVKKIIGVIFFALGIICMTNYHLLVMIYIGMAIFTVGEVIDALGNMPYYTRRVPASHRGRISSFMSIIKMGVGAVSQLLIGFMLEAYSYATVFYIYVILAAIVTVILFILRPIDKKTFPALYAKTDKSGSNLA